VSFQGKLALVTGSTRGIGWAVAERLAEGGGTVLLNGAASPERVDERAAELRERFGGEHEALAFDVGDPAQVEGAFKRIFSEHRGLDVLVNNAGVLDEGVLGMVSAGAAERTFAVNALGVLHAMQGAARLMARRGGGAIVNVSSIVGTSGAPGQVAYGGAKAAVVGMTRSAAKELAPQGVRVNAVAPGMIDTELIASLNGRREAAVGDIGMGRLGSPDDVARAICFLASDDAGYVTGQVLGVDGGMLL
jgi:3-oxoacyl-[acyl-carrier protein] reductase